jgi:hypothetical protein
MTSTPRRAIEPARLSGMPAIICFSRAISAAQSIDAAPTVMPWWCAREISSIECAAATSTFFGMQPRLGQVPPRSRISIIATDSPASRVATVAPIAALPPPRMTTS